MMKIAVFGATGQAGRLICQQLLKEQNFKVITCARTTEKLEKLKAVEKALSQALESQESAFNGFIETTYEIAVQH